MTFQQHYMENSMKMNSINLTSTEMMRNVSNTRPNSDPSYNIGGKPFILQQNNPYVKSMLYENRENTYSEIVNPKNGMISKSMYMKNNFQSSEAEAIDKIFEDLSYYEKTLEEMANAKLDDDFKEEMIAIEQWFMVLSECERTTVLYSLIQNISELQVRFFLTLLQQKVKNNPLYNSIIKRPISDSIYSSSTKHCSNASSDNSSMINSTSADTYYDDDDYQKNSFVDTTNLQNKTTNNQFACPLNMNEYNMALNSLSNVNFLNERSSSLACQSSKNHSHTTHHHSQTQSVTPSAANSRKNSYMGSMMNDYQTYSSTPSGQMPNNTANLGVLRDMNRYSDSAVLLNNMTNASASKQNMMSSQFLTSSQQSLMVNNNTSLYANSSNNIPLLNQTTINSLINPNSLSLLNGNNGNATNGTSALPILSPNTSSLNVLGNNNNQTSPMISPISPPKSSNKTNTIDIKSETSKEAIEKEATKTMNANAKTLTEILLTGKESKDEVTKESNKNAAILSNILTLSKEMNDMVNKNKEKKKEKQAKSSISSPTTPTSPKPKKTSEDSESTVLPPCGAESVVSVAAANPSREKGKIPDQIELESLEDIPTFLRSLRLHKYAPIFEGMNWKQMIRLENDELLKRGVNALGARNKMLKVFDLIRAEAIKQGIDLEC
ncbi:hypothetical protein BCR36DRAFT_317301 [Piromyces finnis]|uniref:SAM domain-containing protein n=1 Tax=Piromyces finnis TaxID=1754191 RepID=A0A1Y1VLC8_9FUNG|nr:hypothetical protein BCR36DRAFT_317301 [Piromyces finnis]|eukprot:ORX59260.1 hypothetical protein BCR36DRAFT_317301 [Piromyces finnis]